MIPRTSSRSSPDRSSTAHRLQTSEYKSVIFNPSIGLLLCATKDEEVIEYALSRALSPTLIAEYQTMLPDKTLLRAKLHEFYLL
jgi:hypothetical protein